MIGPPDEVERRIRQLSRLPLSPDLRDRVMAAARLRPAAASWRDRAWYSTGWRLAAAGAVLAALILDHLSAGLTPTAGGGPDRFAIEELAQIVRLGEESGMSPELASGLASRVEPLPLAARQPRTGDLSQALQ